MPERPASAFFQNESTPMPMGETTPRPVTTTRLLHRHCRSPQPSPTYYAKPPRRVKPRVDAAARCRGSPRQMSLSPDRHRYNPTMSPPVAPLRTPSPGRWRGSASRVPGASICSGSGRLRVLRPVPRARRDPAASGVDGEPRALHGVLAGGGGAVLGGPAHERRGAARERRHRAGGRADGVLPAVGHARDQPESERRRGIHRRRLRARSSSWPRSLWRTGSSSSPRRSPPSSRSCCSISRG